MLKHITIKLIKILVISILLIMLITAMVVVYMLNADRKSLPTKEIKEEYNIVEEEYMGRNVFIIKPKEGTRNNMKILYLHGGSYVAETSKVHWDFLKDLVQETGCTLILPDYPLTPKYNYKDVFYMIEPLYKEIINKTEKENLIMMGDSAGGGLALALAEKMGQENIAQPKHIILLSPWLDVTMSNPKISEIEKLDPVLDKEALKLAGIAYSGKDGKESFLVNPVNGPLEKLENITIYTGTYDILNPDVHTLIEKAKQVNINIDLREVEKAIHIWMIQSNREDVYNAQETFDEIVNQINSIVK